MYKKRLYFAFLNGRSILNKQVESSSVNYSSSADSIGLTETWLSEEIKNEEIFNCEAWYKF